MVELQIVEAIFAGDKRVDQDMLKYFMNFKKQRQAIAHACKARFLFFYRFMFIWNIGVYPDVMDFHEEIIESLQQIDDEPDKAQDIILCMPPNFGKTQMLQYFMLWTFARNKNKSWLYIHGSAKTAMEMAKEMKDVVHLDKSNEEGCIWFKLFGAKLKRDSQAKNQWSFEKSQPRSGFFASGLFGNIIGRNAGNRNIAETGENVEIEKILQELEHWERDVGDFIEAVSLCGGGLIIDDPMDAQYIFSDAIKAKCYEAVMRAIQRVRDRTSCKIIINMQRLCIDDAVGRILEQRELAAQFKHLIYAGFNEETQRSIYERGQRTSDLLVQKRGNPFTFYAQIQQAPIPLGGALIQPEWLQYYDGFGTAQILNRVFITCDTAFSEKKHADYSVISVWATDGVNLYLLDMERGQWRFNILKARVQAVWDRWSKDPGVGYHRKKVDTFYIENKASGQSIIQELRDTNIHVVPVERTDSKTARLLNETKDKMLRFDSVVSKIADGRVHLPRHLPHISDLVIEECCKFTGLSNSTGHDDIVDTLIDAVQKGLIQTGFF